MPPETSNPVADTEEYLDDFLETVRDTMRELVGKLDDVIGGQASVLEKLAALHPIEAVATEAAEVAAAVQDAGEVAGRAAESVGAAAAVIPAAAEDVIEDAAAVPEAVVAPIARQRRYTFKRKRRA